MLSLSNINIQSPATPVAPMSRPALVSEAVSSASPFAEIQPATAISRERSRVEVKAKDSTTGGDLAQQTQVEQMVAEQQAAAQKSATRQGVQSGSPSAVADKPPSDKNSIQKAMETQIKDVLNTVWKASGKAVDFLLGRSETLMDQTLKKVQLPGEVNYLGSTSASSGKSSSSEVVSYTTQGGAGSLGDGKGKILDMVV